MSEIETTIQVPLRERDYNSAGSLALALEAARSAGAAAYGLIPELADVLPALAAQDEQFQKPAAERIAEKAAEFVTDFAAFATGKEATFAGPYIHFEDPLHRFLNERFLNGVGQLGGAVAANDDTADSSICVDLFRYQNGILEAHFYVAEGQSGLDSSTEDVFAVQYYGRRPDPETA